MKIEQITITFISNNYTEWENVEKKNIKTLSMWPTSTSQSLSGT